MEKTFKPEHIKRLINSKEESKIEECILKVELNTEPIGEGGNAIIYIPENESLQNVCIKKTKDKPQIMCNSIDEEHSLQEKAKNAGIRTPTTYLSFINKNDGKEYFLMERINGYSVKDIVKDEGLMPKNFEYEKFCESLDDQINKLHNINGIMGGIYHRDLHIGNVMIDENGLAVIIDFGTAIESSGGEFTYEESTEMWDNKKGRYQFVNGFFKDDLEMVKLIKTEVKKFANLKY